MLFFDEKIHQFLKGICLGSLELLLNFINEIYGLFWRIFYCIIFWSNFFILLLILSTNSIKENLCFFFWNLSNIIFKKSRILSNIFLKKNLLKFAKFKIMATLNLFYFKFNYSLALIYLKIYFIWKKLNL